MNRVVSALLTLAAVAGLATLQPGGSPDSETHALACPDAAHAGAARGAPALAPLSSAGPGLRPRPAARAHAAPRRAQAPPGPAPEDLSDPWLASRTQPGLPYQPVMRTLACVRCTDGRVAFESAAIDLGAPAGALPLVTYDLAGLARDDDARLEPLLGFFHVEGRPPEKRPASDWWEHLARAIVARTGADAWSAPQRLLAWNPGHGLLYVRQDDVALEHVEQVLDEVAARAAGVVPVRVEIHQPGSAPHILDLDVPWRRPVRACRGLAATYLQDFDVEVEQSAIRVDPILARCETGVGVEAVRVDADDGAEETLHVAVVRAEGAPAFSILELPASGGLRLDPIEIPSVRYETWHARLPSASGIHRIDLPGGAVGTLSVGRLERGPAPSRPAWRRAPAHERESRVFDVHALDVRLRGDRHGAIGSGRLLLFGMGGALYGTLTLREPTYPVVRCAQTYRAVARLRDDPPLCGGIQILAATVGCLQAPDALDLTVEIGRTAEPPRRVAFRARASEQGVLLLPSAHVDVLTRRVFLDEDGAGTLTFDHDAGDGPERWTLELRTPGDD